MIAKLYASNANNSQEFGSERDNSCMADVVISRSLVRGRESPEVARIIRIKKVSTMIERSEISYVSISFHAFELFPSVAKKV